VTYRAYRAVLKGETRHAVDKLGALLDRPGEGSKPDTGANGHNSHAEQPG
jgi:hypothetical protein